MVYEREYAILIKATTPPSPVGEGWVRHQAALFIDRGETMHTTHRTFILAGHTVHHVTFDPTTFTDADLLWLPTTLSLQTPGANAKPSIWQAASPPRMPYLTTPCPASAPAVNRSGRKAFQEASPTAARRRWRLPSVIQTRLWVLIAKPFFLTVKPEKSGTASLMHRKRCA